MKKLIAKTVVSVFWFAVAIFAGCCVGQAGIEAIGWRGVLAMLLTLALAFAVVWAHAEVEK